MTAIALSVITFFSTAFGGMFALRWRKQLYLVMGFSAGILVAAALLDLLPDAFEVVKQSGESTVKRVLLCAVMGFLAYYSLELFVHRGAAVHEKRQGKVAFASVAAFGLTVHSFLDGFAIGSAFQENSTMGGLVALAVISHDFGDGVSTVGVVLGSSGALRSVDRLASGRCNCSGNWLLGGAWNLDFSRTYCRLIGVFCWFVPVYWSRPLAS